MLQTIFISSTFLDLQTHRKAVWDVLSEFDVSVRGMEQFGARTETPLETCIVEVEQSDIYVGVIAFRLGSLESGTGKSYTQIEYERARALSKEMLIYLVDEENARVPIKFIDRGEAFERLDAFKKTLRERHTVETFVDEQDLAVKLKRDLKRHLSARPLPSPSQDEFEVAKARLAQFYLLPKSVAGSELRLNLRTTGNPFPASREVCTAFNLEFGATVGLPIEVEEPRDFGRIAFSEAFINAKTATDVLPLNKDDILEVYARLHFTDRAIEQVRARYISTTDFPNSPILAMSAASGLLGAPVHRPADSRLAVEISRIIGVQRTAKSAA